MTPPDFGVSFRTAIGAVVAVQSLDTEWRVEVARVQADPAANFDGLAAFVPRVRQLQTSLAESLADIPDLPDRLASDSAALLATMDSLREQVERFKTSYAVMRNSERYFPLASTELILRANQRGNMRLAREIADISLEMDAFLSSPSDSGRERLSGRFQGLSELGAGETDEVAALLGNFAAHANVLLDRRASTQELFRGITSGALSERTGPLTDLLEFELEDRRRVARLHWQALAGLGAGVLLVWIGVGFARQSTAGRRWHTEFPLPEDVAVEPAGAFGPQSARVVTDVRAGEDPLRDGDGKDATRPVLRGDQSEPVHEDAGVPDNADAQRDADGMHAMEALLATGRLEPAHEDAGAPDDDAQRSADGMHAMEALLAAGRLESMYGNAGAYDDVDAQSDTPERAMAAMEALVSTRARGSVPTDAGSPAGGDVPRVGADVNVMEALLTGGAIAGLMGQTVGAYARRIREDVEFVDRSAAGAWTEPDTEEAAHRLRRLGSDARRIGFFAHRLLLLGRHLAPHDRESIEVNRCLDEILSDAAVEATCVVERHFTAVPDVWASRWEVRLILVMCVEYVLLALQDTESDEAELEVRTMGTADSVTISFIHNGAWVPAEQRPNQFIPFFGSRDQMVALQLPAARHLARKYGGTVDLDSWPDERGVLNVRLSVNASGQ